MFDSHAHLSDPALYPQIDPILQRAKAAGVEHIINICTDLQTLHDGLKLAEKYPWVYNAAAATPHDAHEDQEPFFKAIKAAAEAGQLAAIGETGLEYHYFPQTAPDQKRWLIRFMHLALDLKLPLIIHCREAFNDLFEIIDAEYKGAPGILHCFTGTLEEARGVIERGWYLSLSGIVTYKKSAALQEVAKWVPLDKLLIETDAPYLAPQSNRGKQNEPAYIAETAALIANLKGVPISELISKTNNNTLTAFKLRPE